MTDIKAQYQHTHICHQTYSSSQPPHTHTHTHTHSHTEVFFFAVNTSLKMFWSHCQNTSWVSVLFFLSVPGQLHHDPAAALCCTASLWRAWRRALHAAVPEARSDSVRVVWRGLEWPQADPWWAAAQTPALEAVIGCEQDSAVRLPAQPRGWGSFFEPSLCSLFFGKTVLCETLQPVCPEVTLCSWQDVKI